jgi:heme oxygenase
VLLDTENRQEMSIVSAHHRSIAMNQSLLVIEQLRLRTQSLHQQLEQTPIAQDLMSPMLTLERYTQILTAWRAAWALLEIAVWTTPYALQTPHLLPLKRCANADADLHYLALREATPTPQWRSDQTIEQPQTLAEFVGVCYVLRGAALGGKVIARHLATTLGLSATSGAAFFATADEATTWRQWMQQAESLLHTEQDIEQAVGGAAATFKFLLDKFNLVSDYVPA